MIDSPKVATYDKLPKMSVHGVAEKVAEVVKAGTHEFVMCNFAPPDMVGHTGVWDATIAALESIDACLRQIVEAVEAVDRDQPTAAGALLAIMERALAGA